MYQLVIQDFISVYYGLDASFEFQDLPPFFWCWRRPKFWLRLCGRPSRAWMAWDVGCWSNAANRQWLGGRVYDVETLGSLPLEIIGNWTWNGVGVSGQHQRLIPLTAGLEIENETVSYHFAPGPYKMPSFNAESGR